MLIYFMRKKLTRWEQKTILERKINHYTLEIALDLTPEESEREREEKNQFISYKSHCLLSIDAV